MIVFIKKHLTYETNQENRKHINFTDNPKPHRHARKNIFINLGKKFALTLLERKMIPKTESKRLIWYICKSKNNENNSNILFVSII